MCVDKGLNFYMCVQLHMWRFKKYEANKQELFVIGTKMFICVCVCVCVCACVYVKQRGIHGARLPPNCVQETMTGHSRRAVWSSGAGQRSHCSGCYTAHTLTTSAPSPASLVQRTARRWNVHTHLSMFPMTPLAEEAVLAELCVDIKLTNCGLDLKNLSYRLADQNLN